jgi:hypothetical protein
MYYEYIYIYIYTIYTIYTIYIDESGPVAETIRASASSTALVAPGGTSVSRKKNIKLSKMMKEYALAWVSLAPDDMELLHR